MNGYFLFVYIYSYFFEFILLINTILLFMKLFQLVDKEG